MSDPNPNEQTDAPTALAPATGSVKWVVRDLTCAEPSVSCDTKERAEAWVRHLWEWRPNARPIIEQEISPNAKVSDPARKSKI